MASQPSIFAGGHPLRSIPRFAPTLVGDLQAELVHDFFDGFAARRSRQRACSRALRPLQPSQDRIVVQGICARAARCLLARSPHGALASQHERIALMIAVVDYRAGNLTSVKKALDHLRADAVVTRDPGVVAQGRQDHSPRRRPLFGHRRSGTSRAADCHSATGLIRECRSSASALECSGCSNPAQKRREFRAWDCSREHADAFTESVKSPHVGWNSLTCHDGSRLLRGIPSGFFRVLHSLVLGAGRRSNRGTMRVWRRVLRRRRARQFVRSAISSGKIRSDLA